MLFSLYVCDGLLISAKFEVLFAANAYVVVALLNPTELPDTAPNPFIHPVPHVKPGEKEVSCSIVKIPGLTTALLSDVLMR